MTATTPPEAGSRLSRGVRIGYGSGSVATGAFGTVPGLVLLPYLTDQLGIAALWARRDPRPDDHADRRDGTGDPGPVGGRDGYRVMGVVMALAILVAVVSAWWSTRAAPIGAVGAGAGPLREQLQVVDRVAREAVAAYAASNALDPTAFPWLPQMENELVGFACGPLDAPDTAAGTVTSGGTESILLAVQGARDSGPEVARPRMVLPARAHAAFHKAAHYFGVEAVLVPVGADRADAAAQVAGPVAVDPGVVAFIEALDPDALGDDDFDGPLAASGLVGPSAEGDLDLPTRMAEVNAMLDVASPAMREALLVAFLDRLQRPVRPPR